MTRPAELDDLDRIDVAVLDLDDYCERRQRLYQLSQERLEAYNRGTALLRERADAQRERRQLVFFVVRWALVFLCGVSLVLYLKSRGY